MTCFRLVLVLSSLVGGFGCKPKIGDDCATSVDCSLNGDRLCDVTQPGGYCTVFNCEPNRCPDESVCVAFGEGTCSTASVSTRFRRTFCMRSCAGDSDCRGGNYHCTDISHDESRMVVDVDPASRRICAIPSSSQAPERPDPAVCFPSDASFDVSRPEAGPISRDASVDAETGGDVTGDAASEPETTPGDAASESETTPGDAASEPVSDMTAIDDADGAADADDASNEASD